MNKWLNERINEWMNRRITEKKKTNGRMSQWANKIASKRTNEGTTDQPNEWMNEYTKE